MTAATPDGPPRIAKTVLDMASGAELTATLHDIIDAARDLTGARYGAIGVLNQDGKHREFAYSGISQEHAAVIGPLPEGHGLLGEITRRREVTRTDHIAAHPQSVGTPPGHPPMQSFLGVPILHAGTVLGNLYLTDAPGGFTTEDEQHVVTLAAVAAVAVEKAALLEEANRRGRRLEAAAQVAVAMLSEEDPEESLGLVADNARQVLEADAAVLVLPNMGSSWVIEIASGNPAAAALVGTVMPQGGRTERTVAEQHGMLIDDLSTQADLLTPGLAKYGPALYAPMVVEGTTIGVLILLRNIGGRAFAEPDLVDGEAFARQAALAMEMAVSRRRREESNLLEQRTEIARDLHDFVVQEIFATGAGLGALANRADQGHRVKAEDLQTVLDRLDTAVLAVRQAITSLRSPAEPVPLTSRLLREIRNGQMQLGFDPRVELADAITYLELDPSLVDDIAAITREALSNTARHAAATTVGVSVQVEDDLLVLTVIDDGAGIDPATSRRSGLRTMAERAQRNDWSLSVEPAHPGSDRPGTRVELHLRLPVHP